MTVKEVQREAHLALIMERLLQTPGPPDAMTAMNAPASATVHHPNNNNSNTRNTRNHPPCTHTHTRTLCLNATQSASTRSQHLPWTCARTHARTHLYPLSLTNCTIRRHTAFLLSLLMQLGQFNPSLSLFVFFLFLKITWLKCLRSTTRKPALAWCLV